MENKKIAFIGYGLENKSLLAWFLKHQAPADYTICDFNEGVKTNLKNVSWRLGKDCLQNLKDFDLIYRSPGCPLFLPELKPVKYRITSAMNLFMELVPTNNVIGVTGSKGKGTTASLIASILEHSGRNVWLLGNIGKPGLDVLGDIQQSDVVVYELSSFQLWDLEKSPHIAVVLFIEQEHLDVHIDMIEYVAAKANITKYQNEGDILIYNQSNEYAKFIAKDSKAQLISYTDIATAHVAEGNFYYGEQIICSVDQLKIIGRHNQDNACAAIDAVWGFTHDTDIITKGINAFSGLPHRLHFIRKVNDVEYYDDSIATTPSSAIAALRSFSQPKVIILGGSSKGSDFIELGNELARQNVKAILMGAEANNIALACEKAGFKKYEIIKNPTMSKVVNRASKLAKSGSVVLLSPASASFGLFKNYSDRGEQFEAAVAAL